MKSVVLDTNAYSQLLQGNPSVADQLAKARRVLVSVITLGELYYGFQKGIKAQVNLKTLEKFLNKNKVKVVSVSNLTALFYAKVKLQLKKDGCPIPENDIWLAANCLETNSTILTFDKHFLKIKKLKLEGWARATDDLSKTVTT